MRITKEIINCIRDGYAVVKKIDKSIENLKLAISE